jgi:colanic acid biosynthesis glycosyl transferase WcaI
MLAAPGPLPRLDASKRTLLILSQVYVPDPAAVGQHVHDVAAEMSRRDYEVVVLTSERGYEDPSERYPRYEVRDGVHIVRLGWSSFGKSSISSRMLGGSLFLVQATALALTMPRIDRVLVSTSPPMCAAAGAALRRLRNVPFTFWVMDLNPDQIVAVGRFTSDAAPVRAFDWLNHQALDAAHHVVALDRFMADRLCQKHPVHAKVTVMPPWAHVNPVESPLEAANSPFRAAYGGACKRLVMYSGNLSPVHPVTTILEAARQLRDDGRLGFIFVGGGLGRQNVEQYIAQHALHNVRTFPYQTLSELESSLAAADVHLVTMGNPMIGIVHPCKIYNAMAVGRPILALGPKASHIAEIVLDNQIGWHVEHGDIAGAVTALTSIAELEAPSLRELGLRAHDVAHGRFSFRRLRAKFCDMLEGTPYADTMGASSDLNSAQRDV